MFQGLRTAIYHVNDIEKAKEWYTDILGIGPYFDDPNYVGYNIGGYELGLRPDKEKKDNSTSVTAYWGVDDIHQIMQRLKNHGAEILEDIEDVGDNILVSRVIDPFGNVFGIIQNPHFKPEVRDELE